jgi:hypothetical protein
MNPRSKAILWWALIDTIGLALIFVAVFALDDGEPRDIIGIFSNPNQVYLAAVGVGFMVAAAILLVIGLLRKPQ